MTEDSRSAALPFILLIAVLVCLAISGFHPYDRATWVLETFPIVIGVVLLVPTYRRFPLTSLLYSLLFAHALILMIGGHYTYARVPFGFWLQNVFGLSRNPYDRLGHLAQGFVPALLAREILIRQNVVRTRRWLFFVVISICLAFSALYELLEWATAIVGGDSAESFLGTQGDVWDTQWDMFLAGIGALLALTLLSRFHDRQLQRLPVK